MVRTSGIVIGSCHWRPTPEEACPSAPCCAAACRASEQISHQEPSHQHHSTKHRRLRGQRGAHMVRSTGKPVAHSGGSGPEMLCPWMDLCRHTHAGHCAALPSTTLPWQAQAAGNGGGAAQGLELVERGQQRRQRALQRDRAPHAQHLPARAPPVHGGLTAPLARTQLPASSSERRSYGGAQQDAVHKGMST